MPNDQDYPVLVAQNGPLVGERWKIDRPLVMGREPGCEVVIPERQVSRFHARLTPGASGVVLEDLGSKNGTHYGGARISTPVVLQDGDIFQIAVAQEFQFLSSDATVALENAPTRITGRTLARHSLTSGMGQPAADESAAFSVAVPFAVGVVSKCRTGCHPPRSGIRSVGR